MTGQMKIGVLVMTADLEQNPDEARCDFCHKILRRGQIFIANVTISELINGMSITRDTHDKHFCGLICYRTWDEICDRKARASEDFIAIVEQDLDEE